MNRFRHIMETLIDNFGFGVVLFLIIAFLAALIFMAVAPPKCEGAELESETLIFTDEMGDMLREMPALQERQEQAIYASCTNYSTSPVFCELANLYAMHAVFNVIKGLASDYVYDVRSMKDIYADWKALMSIMSQHSRHTNSGNVYLFPKILQDWERYKN